MADNLQQQQQQQFMMQLIAQLINPQQQSNLGQPGVAQATHHIQQAFPFPFQQHQFQQQHLQAAPTAQMPLGSLGPLLQQQTPSTINLLRLLQAMPQPQTTAQQPAPQPPMNNQVQQATSSTQLGGYRRPSLISNFNNEASLPQVPRIGLPQQQHSQPGSMLPPPSSSVSFNTQQQAVSNLADHSVRRKPESAVFTADLEEIKRALSESLDKNMHYTRQCGLTLKSAKHKVEMLKKIIAENSPNEQSTSAPSSIGAQQLGEDPSAEQSQQEEEVSSSDITSVIARVYAENKRKAAASRSQLNHVLGPPTINQPSTSTVMHKGLYDDTMQMATIQKETYESGLKFLPTLVKAMTIQRRKHQEEISQMLSGYESTLSEWEKKVAKHEKNQKKAARDAKSREIFEKTFPELKKQREEKERSNRVERSRCTMANQAADAAGGSGAATTSSFDLDSENTAKMRSLAIIPPVAMNPPRRFFDDRNGLAEDALADLRNRMEVFLGAWTDGEKSVFEMKIAKYGKNFAAIAAFLPNKTVKDCVQYYYMSKKRKNYKAKFSRKRKKLGRQYKAPLMPQLADLLIGIEMDLAGQGQQAVRGGNCVVECLVCDEKMSIFLPAKQPALNLPSSGFDPYGFEASTSTTDSSSKDVPLPNQLPVCGKCIHTAVKNKNTNRCPLVSCGIGKRKPVRTVPEKFQQLNIAEKRFVVYRLRLPPNAIKCCNSCFKKIMKEVEGLIDGELKEEWDAFNERLAEMEAQQRGAANFLLAGVEEEAAIGDEDDEEEAGGVPGEGGEADQQPFLNITQRQSSLIGSDRGMDVIQPEEPYRKEIKLESGTVHRERFEFSATLGSPKKESASSSGSLTLGTPITRSLQPELKPEFMTREPAELTNPPYFANLNEDSIASKPFTSRAALTSPQFAVNQPLDQNVLSSFLLAQLGISGESTAELSQKLNQSLPENSYSTLLTLVGQDRLDQLKQEPADNDETIITTTHSGVVANPPKTAHKAILSPPIQVNSEKDSERGKRTNFAQQVAKPVESKTVKQYLSEQYKGILTGSLHTSKETTATGESQQQKRKSGLANALLPSPAASSSSKGPAMQGAIQRLAPTAQDIEIKGASAGPERPPPSTSLSYENLSDSGEEDVAGGNDAARTGERFNSTTPPMFYSFLNLPTTGEDASTPSPSQRAMSSSSAQLSPRLMSRQPEMPTMERNQPSTVHTSALSGNADREAKPLASAQCVYEPLSDDSDEC